MENMHLLPTDKPSKLWKTWESKLMLHPTITNILLNKQHIYITSDEEIKEGDWHLHYYEGKPVISKSYNGAVKVINEITEQFSYKKVILTTDADLINDGVQEINDGFLEWFVKNPNCNFVRAIKVPYFDESSYSYVLIIPIEEDFELVSIGEETVKLAIPMIQDREEIKQETLEEVVWKLAKQKFEEKCNYKPNLANPQDLLVMSSIQEGILIGAKWQKEQNKNLYSEEEVRQMFNRYNEVIAHRDNEEWQVWIDKQFKKK